MVKGTSRQTVAVQPEYMSRVAFKSTLARLRYLVTFL